MKKFYVRTYSQGSYTFEATDVLEAINAFMVERGGPISEIHTVVSAIEEGL